MASAKDMLAAFKKDYGDSVGGMGATLHDLARVPTGFFEFDYATGGGFPRGYTSLVYGPESSGKTNLALKAVANHQLLWPEQTCVWFAIESFDPDWARAVGVDVDKLLVMKPDFAEQVVDMVEGFLAADDIGLIVVDSVAAMVGAAAAKKSAEDAIMGGIGTVMTRLCDKVTIETRKAEKAKRPMPTILLVNQMRMKVGIVFGNPMTMPGGAKQKFLSSLTVRVSGKNIMDNKVSKVLPVLKQTQFVLEKWKVPVVAVNGQFQMVTQPHKGLAIGDGDDWKTIAHMLGDLNLLTKGEKGGWVMYDEPYLTLQACRERLYSDKVFGLGVRKALIERAVEQGAVLPEQDENSAE